eukprot:TRINITY_DN9919_c0_g1_i1.p1 TRINITY_DN9919_c0_g1~~TRINITY_DN9919_c0_g1_i1.p1  ORF type:complete len:100 (-),score=9.25 TRINITY_DN9919_c0_g1_i1:144-443(-)
MRLATISSTWLVERHLCDRAISNFSWSSDMERSVFSCIWCSSTGIWSKRVDVLFRMKLEEAVESRNASFKNLMLWATSFNSDLVVGKPQLILPSGAAHH